MLFIYGIQSFKNREMSLHGGVFSNGRCQFTMCSESKRFEPMVFLEMERC